MDIDIVVSVTKGKKNEIRYYRGVSQTLHFVAAESVFSNVQVEHTHDPAAGAGFGFMPAAAQSNPCTTGLVGGGCLDSSQNAHFVAMGLSFLSWQVEQVHDPSAGAGFGFMPAAAQSKPCATGLTDGCCLGSSQTAHFVAAGLSFLSLQVEQIHAPPVGAATGFIPAAAKSKLWAGFEGLMVSAGALNSKRGRDAREAIFALAIASLEASARETVVGIVKVKDGREGRGTARAACLGSVVLEDIAESMEVALLSGNDAAVKPGKGADGVGAGEGVGVESSLKL